MFNTVKSEILNSLAEEETLSKRIKNFKTTLNTEKKMDEFDRLSFESFIENVVIGKYDDNGEPQPYTIEFVLKTGMKFEGLAERQYKKRDNRSTATKMCSYQETKNTNPYSFYMNNTSRNSG